MAEISKKITGEVAISTIAIKDLQKTIKSIFDLKEGIEKSLKGELSKLLEIILEGAIILDASDIHLETTEEKVKLRIRIDGILQDVTFIDKKIYQNILSRIKLLSGIKLNITDRPQDGRFSIIEEIKDTKPTEIRTSSLPTEHGESIVLRILNPKSLIDMEALGLREDLSASVKKEIKKPNGMIIITGPTGSGKTTTLYAFLKKITNPEIKIITIEDPIEYHLKGISQTQVAPEKGYDFASGLKSIVRQDPDVILVGEIRDSETAEIAIQAALTGHLVFTTLHTNDAAGTIARLVSLGVKSQNIAPALNMAVAQRLVRKVCKKCSVLKIASPGNFTKIKNALKGVIGKIKTVKINAGLKIPSIKGCKCCNFTGYKGRVGIFEDFLVDDEMEKFVLENPSISALKERAIKKGMISMKQDGFIKVLEGITTIEEIERVAGE